MCEWFCGPDGEDCVAHYQGSDDLAGTVVARLQRFATMGALRRSVLTSVASKMEEREQESDSLRRLYSEIQSSNGSADGGGIRFEDLVKGLEVRGYSLTREEVRELFEVVDVDHSGDISLSEWIAALTEWHTLEERLSGANARCLREHERQGFKRRCWRDRRGRRGFVQRRASGAVTRRKVGAFPLAPSRTKSAT